ncbi:hypothetical protein HMF7854_11250 [Sphingomonas ginkgonis]|uniref:DUF5681 domain-containing protein n=1 Tax=Sphingomonas ginkgonis TaxID=2315330 RepID=A0A429VC01_9SPHN|nr:DUF5681 domain-containing protein [Sphingomonas ginkgonis]RST31352.1 hypothetical protein HMF7854_11250 [Sphingomonas ginkgonis]
MNKEEQVGPGRPPKFYQFKPGQSGNPKGRPRGSRNLKTIVSRLLDQEVKSPLDRSDVSIREVLVENLFIEAMNGNLKAAQYLLENDGGQDEPRADLEHSIPSPDK